MRTLTKFTFITGLSFGVNMVMLLVRAKTFALLLDPEGVGLLSQVLNIEGLIASFATIGIGYGITNLIAKGPKVGEVNRYAWSVVRTGQLIAIAIAIPVLGFLLVFSRNISEITIGSREFGVLFVIIAIAIPIKFNAAVFNSGLQGLKQIVSLAWVRSLAAVLAFLCILPLTYYLGLLGAVIGLGLWPVFMLLLGRFHFKNSTTTSKNISWREGYKLDLIEPIVRFGFANLLVVLLTRVTLLIVRTQLIRLFGLSSNGYYQVVWAMSSQFLIIVQLSLWSYAYPQLTQLIPNKEQFTKELEGVLRLGLLILGPMIYMIVIFREVVVRILYSSSFSPSISLIPIQIWGDLLRFIIWWIELPLFARGKLKEIVLIEVVWNLTFLTLSLLLLGKVGIEGVSVSYTIAGGVTLLFSALKFKQIEDYRGIQQQRKLLVQVGILILIALLVNFTLRDRLLFTLAIVPIWGLWVLTYKERHRLISFIPEIRK